MPSKAPPVRPTGRNQQVPRRAHLLEGRPCPVSFSRKEPSGTRSGYLLLQSAYVRPQALCATKFSKRKSKSVKHEFHARQVILTRSESKRLVLAGPIRTSETTAPITMRLRFRANVDQPARSGSG